MASFFGAPKQLLCCTMLHRNLASRRNHKAQIRQNVSFRGPEFRRCNTRRSPLEVPSSFCMARHNGMLYTEKSQSFDKNHESLKEFKLQNLPLKAAGARLRIAEQPAPHP